MADSFREIEMGPVGGRLPAGDVTAAFPIDAGILVQFTDGSATVLPDWLRDNCQCHECRIVQTDERRWQPWTQPTAPRVTAVDVVDSQLHVDWEGGHHSTFGPAEWQKIRTTGTRGAWTARLWNSGYEIERFDHQQCIADQVTRRGMFEAIRRDGAAVVTGSPTEPGTVLGVPARARPHGARFFARPDLRRQARSRGLQHRVHGRGGPSAQRQRAVHASAQRPGAGDARQRCTRWQQRRGRRMVGARPTQSRTSRGHRRAEPRRGRVPAVLDRGRRVHPGAARRSRPHRPVRAPSVLQPVDAAVGLRRRRSCCVVPRVPVARRSDRRPRQPRVVPPRRPATPCSSTVIECCTPARPTNPTAPATCRTCTSRWTTCSATWRA